MNNSYHNRDVVVLGAGRTGHSLVRWLRRHGARVRVADSRVELPPALAAEWPDTPVTTGAFDAATFAGADMIAISPGVPKDQPAVAEAVARGVDLAGDVEIFARALPPQQKVLAITGTNGKTTTTALTGALTRAAGLATRVAGNIGTPVLDVLAEIENGATWPDVFVLELSSYQLETTHSLKLAAATVLNVTANHLDRYAGLADYAAAKARIFQHCNVAIVNRDDSIVRLMRRRGETVQTFGTSVPQSEEEWGLVPRADGAWLARGGELLLPAHALALQGRHNAQNALAALALTAAVARIRPPVIDALKAFSGLPHRMQTIADAHGVLFVDDSKATTVAATVAALEGGARPVVLIAGGDGKGQGFAAIRAAVDAHCRAVLLIGRDAPLIERALAGSPAAVETAGTLEHAVPRAVALAQAGDVVLLSPACASLDQFASYEARGERFAELVRAALAESVHA
ncbi:MAG TPA: UDP-N-acetylmuramoyl-L-alanine--D-glutamate ligase [Casimicrobiaceae bacterium]|nr:UDP-N-acetylmuramoyl-L-alanine--D-glutamate ligase [Casimicrobiaceae bacterium]